MMMQLNPPIPVWTPKGEGIAHALIDYGLEHDLLVVKLCLLYLIFGVVPCGA